MNKETIFIHVPKTGGTTINTAMHNTYWQTKTDFHYRHIILDSKCSNSADIFDPANFGKYSQYNIFTMLRDPVDRMISEFYFLRERKEFINLLKPEPKSFEDYILNRQTHNPMIGFLLGKRIYDRTPVEKKHLEQVITAINSIPIHVGIFEYYTESMVWFSQLTGIKWQKKIEAKRMTFRRPETTEVSEELKNLILKNNQLDTELYDHCLNVFLTEKKQLPKQKINFIKSKYNHILPYTAKTCLFEFCMENKNYLKQNRLYFRDLTFYLLKDLKIRDGKTFVQIWNATFENTVNHDFPDSPFSKAIEFARKSNEEPLEQTISMGEAMDELLSHKKNNKFYKELKFQSKLVIKPISEKHNFLRKLFGR